jgi:hypothetical protein
LSYPARPHRNTVGSYLLFLALDFLPPFRPEDFRGTFAPFFLASERPIAIACLRLFTLPPLPPFPDLRVPFFRRRIADSTRLLAALPYLRLPDDFFRAAILILLVEIY